MNEIKSTSKKPVVVNLFGGPGSGKSTLAASIFSLLKLNNIGVELVTEFAKELTWEKRYNSLKNQYYVWGNQYHRIHMLLEQVDVIITDSPIMLSVLYGKQCTDDCFTDLVVNTHKQLNNLNFVLERQKAYYMVGRTQTLEEAIDIDKDIRQLLIGNSIEFEEVPGNIDGINIITSKVLNKIIGRDSSIKIINEDVVGCV